VSNQTLKVVPVEPQEAIVKARARRHCVLGSHRARRASSVQQDRVERLLRRMAAAVSCLSDVFDQASIDQMRR
jgi:hypothetical protein